MLSLKFANPAIQTVFLINKNKFSHHVKKNQKCSMSQEVVTWIAKNLDVSSET